MKSGSESDIKKGLQSILNKISQNRFICKTRKNSGQSAIDKPVDLQISIKKTSRAVIAIEVANVNTTQLVGEACRLYYDCCPLKLLILGDRNIPKNGKELCEKVLAKLYGQNDINYTPARVFKYNEDKEIENALKRFLCCYKNDLMDGGG